MPATARMSALLAAGILLLPAAALAQPAETAPTTEAAPPAESDATAAEVEGVLAVGETHARADDESGEATGNAVRIGDEAPSEELGGTQSGEGESGGALIDTGETELGQVQVTPWSASVEEGDDERNAESDAALARVTVIDRDAAHVDVLASESSARHTDGRSSAESESKGADVMLGGDDGLRLIVLHAQTRSEGEGGSTLLAVNDTAIGTSDQADGQCQLDVPELVRLVCLTAEGGAAEGGTGDGGLGTDSAADVLLVDTRSELPSISVVGASSTSGPGSTPAAVDPAPGAPTQVATAAPTTGPAAPAAPAAAASPGVLATTGMGAEGLALTALALLLLGGLTIAHARVRGAFA